MSGSCKTGSGKADFDALRSEKANGVALRHVNFCEVTAPLLRNDKLVAFLCEYLPRRHEGEMRRWRAERNAVGLRERRDSVSNAKSMGMLAYRIGKLPNANKRQVLQMVVSSLPQAKRKQLREAVRAARDT